MDIVLGLAIAFLLGSPWIYLKLGDFFARRRANG